MTQPNAGCKIQQMQFCLVKSKFLPIVLTCCLAWEYLAWPRKQNWLTLLKKAQTKNDSVVLKIWPNSSPTIHSQAEAQNSCVAQFYTVHNFVTTLFITGRDWKKPDQFEMWPHSTWRLIWPDPNTTILQGLRPVCCPDTFLKPAHKIITDSSEQGRLFQSIRRAA